MKEKTIALTRTAKTTIIDSENSVQKRAKHKLKHCFNSNYIE